VTGAYLAIPYSEMVRTIREVAPRAKRIGTLFTPGETNSMVARQRFEEVVKKEGLELLSLPVNGATDVADTALTVCQSGVDIFCQISDSLTNSSFPAIARACESTKTPLFSFSPGQIKTGAILAVGSDYSENGREAGLIVAEVIGGKDPSRIPFRAAKKIRRSVNLDTARRFGITVPERWVRQADEVLPAPPAGTR
jgi:putative ABC transport system substrate-binding protein